MIYMGNSQVGFNALTSLRGKGASSDNPVKFRDCDGTILYSYTLEKISSMEYLPLLPTRKGLTCQSWNWTLQQIKEYAATYGKCEVGATYTTDDGKTRIKITIRDPKYTTIPIVFQQTVANGVTVNWGDGSSDQTYSGIAQQTISHTYTPSAYPTTYTITFNVTSGTMSFPTYIMGMNSQSTTSPRSAFLSMIDEVNIGNGVTSIGQYAFQNCFSLAFATISNSVTSIGNSVFYNCYSLASATIPSSITYIGQYTFQSCVSLASVTIPSLVTGIGKNAFQNCYSLASATIPSSVTSIGDSAFSGCSGLTSVTIPDSVTSIGGSTFQNCFSLASATIPSSVISIQGGAFYQCYSLASVAIPSSVTSIQGSTFQYCYGMKTFDFRRSTSVPTLADVSAFQYTPTVKEIVVPDELYDAWIAATNWSSSDNQIKESIVKASESSLGPL